MPGDRCLGIRRLHDRWCSGRRRRAPIVPGITGQVSATSRLDPFHR